MAYRSSIETADPIRKRASGGDDRKGDAGPPCSQERADGNRILIVDDSPFIHEDFREILRSDSADELAELTDFLFGATDSSTAPMSFAIDSAHQGQEALAMVQRAVAESDPYAVCFLDVRMPPGWDGPTTLTRLWDVAPDLQVVLCTAHSDYSWNDLLDRFGHTDGLLILKKPFEVPEVRQLAHALAAKWRLARDNRRRLDDLEARVAERTRALEQANRELEREMAERVRAREELERARRLESLGRLVAGIGHEVNNPLSLVTGSLELALGTLREAEHALPADVRRDLDEWLCVAQIGSDRIRHIIHNIRAFARPSPGDCQPLDVADALDVAVKLVAHEVGEHIELTLALGELPLVLGHRIELEQVLCNLLTNAAHALATIPAGEARIAITGRRDGDHVVIVVADTGGGIEDEVLQNVFDPFFTTKAVGQGTGLGLSLCHGMVIAMGGTITVDSDRARGTRVTVRLPAAPADAAIEPDRTGRDRSTAPRSTPAGPIARILIVEDEPLIVQLMLRALHPHEVTGVLSGAAGLRRCLDEEFDVVFCDVMMPGATGMDIYRALKESRPDILDKIVFITGGASIDEVRAFLDEVPNPRLEKPISQDQLREHVARLFAPGGAAGA